MTHARRSACLAAALAAAAVFAAGCGKADAPKVDAGAAPSASGSGVEQAEANKRAREDAFGTQVKAHDQAKALQDDLNKKAQDNLEKADSLTK